MTSYLKKLLEERLLERFRSRPAPAPAHGATPLLNQVLAEQRARQRRQSQHREEPAPPPPPRIDHLPAGSRVVSNGNGKNVYLGDIPANDRDELLRLLDDPSLSIDEDHAFDPYDHSDSWRRDDQR
ncbi:hypothetical protein [Lentisalinibacter salinarum]|uniref:hypothetical protein n=1 Tax=Lentisalinibacter salinarum TaxID=2992239 RepID=UPI0038668B7E